MLFSELLLPLPLSPTVTNSARTLAAETEVVMPVSELVDATKHALLSNSSLLLNVTRYVKKLAAETEEVMHV